MHSLTPSRLFPVFKAAACALAATGLLDVFLGVCLGVQPAWLPAAIESDVLASFGSRLATVEQLKQSGRVTDARLVVVTGLSPVREGLDPAVLMANDPLHRDWLVLGAQGRTFATLEVYVRALSDSTLRPQTVILGISPAMLHHDDHAILQDAAPADLPRHLRRHQINHVLLDCSWLYRNQEALAGATTLALYDGARDVRAALGLAMSATYPPEKDPWTSWTSVFQPRADQAHMIVQWQGHQDVLTPSQFQSIDRQTGALRSMVSRLRAGGADVICVLMPETSRLRALAPPIVAEQFDRAIAAVSADGPLRLIDLRDKIPDDMFWDDAHLNPDGRRLLSSQLPSLLP